MDISVSNQTPSWLRYESYEDTLPNHVLVQRVATAAGVSTQSVIRTAKRRYRKEGKRDRRRIKGCPYTFVSLSLWDDYMQIGNVRRVPTRPDGWLTVKALLTKGIGKRRAYDLIHEGKLEAVYVGNTIYINPKAAQSYILRQREHVVAPGWIRVGALYKKANKTKQALSAYIKRNDIETRRFKHPERDQLVSYVRDEVARAYLGLEPDMPLDLEEK